MGESDFTKLILVFPDKTASECGRGKGASHVCRHRRGECELHDKYDWGCHRKWAQAFSERNCSFLRIKYVCPRSTAVVALSVFSNSHLSFEYRLSKNPGVRQWHPSLLPLRYLLCQPLPRPRVVPRVHHLNCHGPDPSRHWAPYPTSKRWNLKAPQCMKHSFILSVEF